MSVEGTHKDGTTRKQGYVCLCVGVWVAPQYESPAVMYSTVCSQQPTLILRDKLRINYQFLL